MATINGKEVVFRDKLESARWWPLLPVIASMQAADESLPEAQRGIAVLTNLEWPSVRALFAASVASWEFDGDPADEASYDRLDLFQETIPLLMALTTTIGERASDLGESESASI